MATSIRRFASIASAGKNMYILPAPFVVPANIQLTQQKSKAGPKSTYYCFHLNACLNSHIFLLVWHSCEPKANWAHCIQTLRPGGPQDLLKLSRTRDWHSRIRLLRHPISLYHPWCLFIFPWFSGFINLNSPSLLLVCGSRWRYHTRKWYRWKVHLWRQILRYVNVPFERQLTHGSFQMRISSINTTNPAFSPWRMLERTPMDLNSL